MNDDEIEDILRREPPGRPSEALDQRMDALFANAGGRRSWYLRWARPVPAWALAAACAVSAAGGFLVHSLWRPRLAPVPPAATISICMIDSNRALARRLLGSAEAQANPRRPAFHISVQTDDPPQQKD